MKIETEILDDHQARLIVELDPAPLEEAKQRAAQKLSKRTKIPGFRPGKAPYAMVLRHLGEATVLEEAIDLLIDEIYPKVIEEAGIEPYGPGSLQEIKSLTPPTFEFLVPLAASVELGDYRSLRLPYEPQEVSEDEINQVVDRLRQLQAIIEPVDRAAQPGDLVNLHVSAIRLRPAEGENATLLDNKPLQLIVENEGEEIEQDLPFPGFTDHLVGMKAGEEKEVIYTFPEDSALEELRGVEASFRIKVDQVNTRTLPEIGDELAQSSGDFATLEDLRKAIRSELEDRKRTDYNEEYDEAVLDEIISRAIIKYPPQMLERETEAVLQRLIERLESQGLDLNLYLKARNIDREALIKEVTPVAEKRLKRSLVLYEIAEKENIEIDPEKLKQETELTLQLYSRVLPAKELRKLSTKDSATYLVGNIMMDMIIDETMQRLRNLARGIEKEKSEPEESAPEEELPVEMVESAAESTGKENPSPSVEENPEAESD